MGIKNNGETATFSRPKRKIYLQADDKMHVCMKKNLYRIFRMSHRMGIDAGKSLGNEAKPSSHVVDQCSNLQRDDGSVQFPDAGG